MVKEKQLIDYKTDLEKELNDILNYWISNTIDNENGGYIGRIDSNNIPYNDAPKGSVLNSRILYSFSAAYNLTKNEIYLQYAYRAYDYIIHHFIDEKYGGVYWTVNNNGEPIDTKKQIYALAFAVYGLTEYYKACKNKHALNLAIELYNKIVNHSYDKKYGGYIEAFARDWTELKDLRLSEKDANERKSMNTHLHVLECFTNLYSVWQNAELKNRLVDLINIFLEKIIGSYNHLNLFFDDDWASKTKIISYGHDIESAWLLQEAAEVIYDPDLLKKVKDCSIQIVKAATSGIDKDGGLWYEYYVTNNHLIKEKHSWPQAEAMVGFFNAWQITGQESFLNQSINSWHFTQNYIKDKQFGEWFWGVKEDHSPMKNEDKVGIWKCPYHNSRACIEIIKRISKTLNSVT